MVLIGLAASRLATVTGPVPSGPPRRWGSALIVPIAFDEGWDPENVPFTAAGGGFAACA